MEKDPNDNVRDDLLDLHEELLDTMLKLAEMAEHLKPLISEI